jgi:zinc protease
MKAAAPRRVLTAALSVLPMLTLCETALPAPQEPPSSVAAAAAPTSPVVTVPRLDYKKRTLPNGLTVYSAENHGSPTVAIQVWYKVGAKDDPTGRSGFAHLFEHMMFKSTRNMKSEMMDRLTEDVGGENNAYTTEDVTVYHETVPSNYLETLLWAEADRMAHLSVNDGNFASERSVVKEEYRQSVLADPYGRLGIYLNEKSWAAHPYKRDVIGSIRDLDAATLTDVLSFYKTFYRPDNAVLVVVGDFDAAQLDAWVDKYFGRLTKPETEVPRVTIKEPERTKEHRYVVTAPRVPLPEVAVTYLVPPISDGDTEALRIADVLLSGGESSRLYRSLVYEQRIASEAGSYADLRADAGLWVFEATAASKKPLASVEKALFAEIERFKATPVSDAELQKARNQLLAGALHERETSDGLASALGHAAVMMGDPERVNTDISRLQAVTAADVQRVAQKYLLPENRMILWYEDGKGKEAISTASSASAGKASAAATPPVAGGETPPAPAAPRTVSFPAPVEKALPNGLRVITVPKPGTGLVTVELALQGAGGANDPVTKDGLADFTATLLTRGTKTRSATKIAQESEALGASISSGAGWDSATVSLSVMKVKLESALPIFADVVLHPAFDVKEITRLREETLDSLQVDLEEPGTLARYVAARVVFGETPYGHPLGGTPETLRRLQRVDTAAFYNRRYRPGGAVLVFGGDITPDEAFTYAQTHFGSWAGQREVDKSVIMQQTPAVKRRIVVIDKSDAGQAAVFVERRGIKRADPTYYPGLVANSVLGDGFSSRINQEIRIKRGLSYGAGSSFAARAEVGPFVASAQTKNESAAEVASLLIGEIERLEKQDVPAAELTTRKASLSGDYARGLETGGGLTGEVAGLALFNIPLPEISAYLPKVSAVTAAEVKKFASTRIAAKDASIVIVGAANKFLPDLKKRFPGTKIEVIPAAQLDLNHAALVRKAPKKK